MKCGLHYSVLAGLFLRLDVLRMTQNQKNEMTATTFKIRKGAEYVTWPGCFCALSCFPNNSRLLSVTSGLHGGSTKNPTYDKCTVKGHARFRAWFLIRRRPAGEDQLRFSGGA